MKIVTVAGATALLALTACKQERAAVPPLPEVPAQAEPPAPPPAPAPGQAAPHPADVPPVEAATLSGPVLETMNAAGYTYIRIDAGKAGKVWAALPMTPLKVGDIVSFEDGMTMRNFTSKSLGRTFDVIYFASLYDVKNKDGTPRTAPASQPAAASQPARAPAPVSVKKAEGGLTVAEVFAQAKALAGKQVVLRGKVVKYNAGILGKNWLHVQDGTGGAGTNDLTVTTDATVNLGDVVLVKGVLATDRDFGGGYSYPVIVENATVTP